MRYQTGGSLRLGKFELGQNRLFWALHDNRIVNVLHQDEVLDISGGNRGDGAEVIAWQKHGGPNQQWEFQYI